MKMFPCSTAPDSQGLVSVDEGVGSDSKAPEGKAACEGAAVCLEEEEEEERVVVEVLFTSQCQRPPS